MVMYVRINIIHVFAYFLLTYIRTIASNISPGIFTYVIIFFLLRLLGYVRIQLRFEFILKVRAQPNIHLACNVAVTKSLYVQQYLVHIIRSWKAMSYCQQRLSVSVR